MNEHRYRQAAHWAESVGSYNTKRPSIAYEPPPNGDMLERPDDPTGQPGPSFAEEAVQLWYEGAAVVQILIKIRIADLVDFKLFNSLFFYPLFLALQDSLRDPRQTEDLPSQDETEDDYCEIAAHADYRDWIDHLKNFRRSVFCAYNRPHIFILPLLIDRLVWRL